MLTGLSQILIVISALAPIAAMYAATQVQTWRTAACVLAGAAFLVLVAEALLRAAIKYAEPRPVEIKDCEPLDKDAVAFLVAYALPLVSATSPRAWIPLIVFAVLMGAVIWQQQLFHVNPVLALLGWHFSQAVIHDNSRVLLMSRGKKQVIAGNIVAKQITSYVWLFMGVHHGNEPLRPSGRQDRPDRDASTPNR